MDDWFHGRNDAYVTHVEALLLQTMSPENQVEGHSFDGTTPAHYYGELAKTREGCELLKERGHFNKFVDCLVTMGMEDTDLETIHKVKAALWAVGNIGATEGGAPFLVACNVVEKIIKIAEQSEVATLRGTAYYVLGLIGSTTLGMQLLAVQGWHVVTTNMGLPTGICVPNCTRAVLHLDSWSYAYSDVDKGADNPIDKRDPLSAEILQGLANLSNHILANEAATALIRSDVSLSTSWLT